MFKEAKRIFTIESMAYPLEQSFSKNYAFDGESHDFVEIVYIQSGKVEVSEDEKIYLLEGGNMIFHAPMEFHRIKSADGTMPQICNLSVKISGTVPDSLYDGVFELDLEERAQYVKIFNAANRFIRGNLENEIYAAHLIAVKLEAFIINICARNNKSTIIASDAGAAMYKRLVRTMNEHIYENISLSELAKINYISVSYVKSLFYRYAGTSPGYYYAKLRVHEATQLIKNGFPIAEISEKLNFSSPNYFSLFFKKMTGQTPSACKKSAAR